MRSLSPGYLGKLRFDTQRLATLRALGEYRGARCGRCTTSCTAIGRSGKQGPIQFWVRSLVRRERSSFFLQKADGRFYPNFLCQLPVKDSEPGPILAGEYKGGIAGAAVEDDGLIGALWPNLSEGRYRIVMVKDRRWGVARGEAAMNDFRRHYALEWFWARGRARAWPP